jgi:ribonucleoside-triphosphate reductase
MNEACLNAKWLKKDLTNVEAQEFTKDVLNHMRNRLSDYQEKYGDLYNLEATPAESTSYRLAKHDVARYPDIITAGGDCGTPYYTNSSHLPVNYTSDIFDALDIQDELQTLYTSGTVFHAFLGEKLPSWKSAANLVRKIAENYKLPYYTMSPTYSICRKHGYLTGEQYRCPHCGEVTEVYSRITGYYRPVQNWNAGKTQEFKDRRLYDIPHSQLKRAGQVIVDGADCCDTEAAAQVVERAAEAAKQASNEGRKLLLFATKTCPNCRMAKTILDNAGIKYEVIDAEENPELTKKYEVKQAPTLIVAEGPNIEKIVNASNIKRFAIG